MPSQQLFRLLIYPFTFTSFLPPTFYHGRGRRTRQMFERQKSPAGPGEERRIAVFWHWLKEKHPVFYEVFWDVILLIAIAALIRSF